MQNSEGIRFIKETPDTHSSCEVQDFIQQEIDKPSKAWVQEVIQNNRESEFVKLRTDDFVLLPDLNGHKRQSRVFRPRPTCATDSRGWVCWQQRGVAEDDRVQDGENHKEWQRGGFSHGYDESREGNRGPVQREVISNGYAESREGNRGPVQREVISNGYAESREGNRGPVQREVISNGYAESREGNRGPVQREVISNGYAESREGNRDPLQREVISNGYAESREGQRGPLQRDVILNGCAESDRGQETKQHTDFDAGEIQADHATVQWHQFSQMAACEHMGRKKASVDSQNGSKHQPHQQQRRCDEAAKTGEQIEVSKRLQAMAVKASEYQVYYTIDGENAAETWHPTTGTRLLYDYQGYHAAEGKYVTAKWQNTWVPRAYEYQAEKPSRDGHVAEKWHRQPKLTAAYGDALDHSCFHHGNTRNWQQQQQQIACGCRGYATTAEKSENENKTEHHGGNNGSTSGIIEKWHKWQVQPMPYRRSQSWQAQTKIPDVTTAQTQQIQHSKRFNWLAIIADPKIRSIRDLRAEHIGMLESMYEQCVRAIQLEYNVDASDIMAFANYPPSVYRLHFHFCAPFYQPTAYDAFRMHSVSSILNNLRMYPMYYKMSTFHIPVHGSSELQKVFSKIETKNDLEERLQIKS